MHHDSPVVQHLKPELRSQPAEVSVTELVLIKMQSESEKVKANAGYDTYCSV